MAKLNLSDAIVIVENGEVTEMTINTIEKFADAMVNRINETQNKFDAEIVTVTKSNDEKLIGIAFKTAENCTAPTFYVEGAFEAFKDGIDLDTLVDDIIREAERHAEHLPNGLPTADELDFSFDKVKDSLKFKVLGDELNKDYLKNVLSISLADGLSAVPYIDFGGGYCITVNDKVFDEFGCSEEDVFSTMLNNPAIVESARLNHLSAPVLGINEGNLLDEDYLELDCDSEPFVLTTEDGFFGASALFCSDVMERIGSLLGVSYFVLPSSVHELILIPDTGKFDTESLKDMVLSANEMVVAPNEKLSDNVYRYSFTFRVLQKVA